MITLSNYQKLPGFKWGTSIALHEDFHRFTEVNGCDCDPWSCVCDPSLTLYGQSTGEDDERAR